MDEKVGHQRDLLNDRSWIDRWAFLLFAFAGAAAILVAKSRGVTAIPVAAGAAITMVAYAFIVQTSGTGRLRADQAGDNCYYLGLIYTLISLAYAIFFFDPATTATTVVQGFGVALATTIMGLVLRVFFNQSRVDLVETEDTARIELAEAAGRLKSELQAMTVSMSDYGRETRQVLEELRDQVVGALSGVHREATRAIGETSSTAIAAVSSMSAEASMALSQQSEEALARTRRLSAATEKVVAGLGSHAETIGRIQAIFSKVVASMAAVDGAADRTQLNLSTLADHAAELISFQRGLASTGTELQAVVTSLIEQVKSFDATAVRFDKAVVARIEEIKALPGETVRNASQAVARAVEAMEEQLGVLARGQQSFVDRLALRTEAGVATLDRHNKALEEELGRSRDNVAKVHRALVELTGTLTDRVNASGL